MAYRKKASGADGLLLEAISAACRAGGHGKLAACGFAAGLSAAPPPLAVDTVGHGFLLAVLRCALAKLALQSRGKQTAGACTLGSLAVAGLSACL